MQNCYQIEGVWGRWFLRNYQIGTLIRNPSTCESSSSCLIAEGDKVSSGSTFVSFYFFQSERRSFGILHYYVLIILHKMVNWLSRLIPILACLSEAIALMKGWFQRKGWIEWNTLQQCNENWECWNQYLGKTSLGKTCFLSGIARKGGGGLPMPEFVGTFFTK